MIYIGIDPGLKAVGWAVLSADRVHDCGDVIPEGADTGEKILSVVGNFLQMPIKGTCMTLERMKVYPGRRMVGDPAHLIDISLVGGAIVGALRPHTLMLPTAMQWNAGAPKDVSHNRIRKRLRDFDPDTLLKMEAEGRSEHAWDAVGLALYGMDKTDANTKTKH